MTAEEMTLTEAETQQTETPAPLNLRTLFVAGVHFGHPTIIAIVRHKTLKPGRSRYRPPVQNI